MSGSEKITLQLLINQPDVISCADLLEEHLARFPFGQDAHDDTSEIATQGVFLAAIAEPAFSLASILVSPKARKDAFFKR